MYKTLIHITHALIVLLCATPLWAQQPLYVVNGRVVETIEGIPQSDIESIETLPADEETIAKWGLGASEGVIVVRLIYDTPATFAAEGVNNFTAYLAKQIKWKESMPAERASLRLLIAEDGTATIVEVLDTTSRQFLKRVAGQAFGELPTASKDGYRFIGWFTAAEGGEQVTPSTTAIPANQTLYAHYEKTYTYTFLNYDGSVFASGQLPVGSVIPLPEQTPARPADSTHYYTFTGCEGYTAELTISEDISFPAQFEQHKIEVLPEITTESFVIRDGFLRAVSSGIPLADLQQKLIPAEFITIEQGSAAVADVAATGMTVTYRVDGEPLQALTIVVTGDTNGDGKCSLTDMVQLQSHLLGKTTLSGAAAQAADINGDGKVTLTDMVQITGVLLGKHTLTPN